METITYEKLPHQYAAEQVFLAELATGSYTLTNPLVKLNPYEFCPLTAVILFETPVASEATITVLGKDPAGNISHTFPAAKKHILPIYGLYADYENTVEIVLANGEKEPHSNSDGAVDERRATGHQNGNDQRISGRQSDFPDSSYACHACCL